MGSASSNWLTPKDEMQGFMPSVPSAISAIATSKKSFYGPVADSRHLLPLPLFFRSLARNRPPTRLFFSNSTMASPPSKKVLVPITNGTEPLEAVITIDVLRRAGAEVIVASVEKNLRVDASLGIKLVADALVVDCEESSFDLISLPLMQGGMPGAERLRDCGVLESIVKRHAEKGGLYAAICAAPVVALGSWGLL